MEIITVKNAQQGSQKAFNLLAQNLQAGAKVLGLATGSTPVELYKLIIASDLDFTDITTINLDEYVGLAPQDPQSYHYFMQKQLFAYKQFKQSFIPDGATPDLQNATKQYDQIIDENPIDFQILGIGQNGHIGFNEPQTSFNLKTHVTDLTDSTIAANARFFADNEQVPTQAISMGIASIMPSKQIVLMAWGADKATAIAQMVNGPITENCPASVLQQHPHATVIIDDAAAAKL
ncbi:glucosamine-6-phosphate deaminase [Bombilactobacillus thymidiniphilus]|uniref:Glucosamine-6-phosphate deaminase n=1 Tax=Bombilactobacillus thymidiniphilus TaxID=2923363 RepID=A0ABY4PB52_9LACO|nr:glucosamine-6-phosphate deaminase [Bombilactobacillus thymidiniphilus]UQS82969.1 glucosamine-6-phosphate deaminase [Bombilactobacillus thymidiniphilus]